jgi:hypothetical protein
MRFDELLSMELLSMQSINSTGDHFGGAIHFFFGGLPAQAYADRMLTLLCGESD